MSVVTVDEMFGWKDDLGRKAFEHFGRRHQAYVSPQTYENIKSKCRERRYSEVFVSMNDIAIGVIEGLPDGLLVPSEQLDEYLPARVKVSLAGTSPD